MSAFKAANPGAVFEDFVRWHLPDDWIEDDHEYVQDGYSYSRFLSISTETENNGEPWPPRGRLSQKMSQPGNVWAQIWDQILPEAAYEQRPLFDYKREGEKVSSWNSPVLTCAHPLTSMSSS